MPADSSSGVLVANLGHNPASWWRRTIEYLGMWDFKSSGDFFPVPPLTAYNAVTELERPSASERLIALLQSQPGGGPVANKCCGPPAAARRFKMRCGRAIYRRPGADIILATRSRISRQEGIGRRGHGLRERYRNATCACALSAFRASECVNIEACRQPIDLAPYIADLGRLPQRVRRADRVLDHRALPRWRWVVSSAKGIFAAAGNVSAVNNDIVFILDEVQANFGRTGSLFAFTEYGVEPDLVVLGKGLGNGVPVAAAVGRGRSVRCECTTARDPIPGC